MKIRINTIKELVEITAGLVRESVCFDSYKEGSYWIVEFTGGY